MNPKKIWSLSIDVPVSAVESLSSQLPEKALGESAFIKDPNDRSKDPIWVLQAYYKDKPDLTALSVAASVLAQSFAHKSYMLACEQVSTEGWVEKNQASYVPIQAGRILIHGVKERGAVAPHQRGVEMDISCAFGTGEHPTTFGCLMALQRLRLGPHAKVLDVGTGTGVLAIAATKLFRARVWAGDMDAPSVLVAKENAQRNRVAARISNEVAMGARSSRMQKNRPYDLILCNIFARPLAKLAPAFKPLLKRGGTLILAGFLHKDANWVRLAYAAQGIALYKCLRFGHWSILILKKQ